LRISHSFRLQVSKHCNLSTPITAASAGIASNRSELIMLCSRERGGRLTGLCEQLGQPIHIHFKTVSKRKRKVSIIEVATELATEIIVKASWSVPKKIG